MRMDYLTAHKELEVVVKAEHWKDSLDRSSRGVGGDTQDQARISLC